MASPGDNAALDKVIKRDDNVPKHVQKGEHFVGIKIGSDEIVKPSSWGFGKKNRYVYRVYTDVSGHQRAEGRSNTIYVRDPETNDSVNLVVSYQASCPESKVETLVRALGQYGSPDSELRRHITAIAERFLFGREREFFANFEKLRSELAQKISNAVTDETGLNFRAQVQLAREEDLSPFHIKQQIEVRFRDSQQPQPLAFECDLDVVPQLTLRAIVTYDKLRSLNSTLVNAVSDYFRLQVPAEDYAKEFAGTNIAEGLRARLNEIAAKHGRQINGLTLRAQKSAGYIPPNFVEKTLHTQVQPLGRIEPIALTSRIQLMREDLGRFQRSGVANLEDWLKESFDNVIRLVCFEKKYLEYLQSSSWTVIESQIKDDLTVRAKTIGYQVKQIFSLPELKENDLKDLKHHRFDIVGLPLRSTAPAHVDINLAATFFIKDWNVKRIAERVNQGVDLKADIARELHQALSSVLATEWPNDFILKFSSPDDAGESIESRLKDAAETTLIEKYQAEVSSVVVTPVDNDEIRRVRDMLYAPRVIDFISTPYSGPENIEFTVTWQVIDIEPNSWDKVSRPGYDLDVIEKSLKDALVGMFNGIEPQMLYTTVTEDIERLSKIAFVGPTDQIRSLYGLGVELSNLTRRPTGSESGMRKTLGKRRDVQLDIYNEQLDMELEISRSKIGHEIQVAKRRLDWSEARFERWKELRSKGRLTAEERDELVKLESEYERMSGDRDGTSTRTLPPVPEMNLDSDAAKLRNMRRTMQAIEGHPQSAEKPIEQAPNTIDPSVEAADEQQSPDDRPTSSER